MADEREQSIVSGVPPERCSICNRPASAVVWHANHNRTEHYCPEHIPKTFPGTPSHLDSYIAHAGSHCPHCHANTNIHRLREILTFSTAHPVYPGKLILKMECSCSLCSGAWTDLYQLVGIEDPIPPN